MAIDVEWQDENGQVLARYDGPLLDVGIMEIAPKDSCCLRFIDPWGNTIFNQMQVAVLLQELQALMETLPPEKRHWLSPLAAFVRGAANEDHTYIKFIGD